MATNLRNNGNGEGAGYGPEGYDTAQGDYLPGFSASYRYKDHSSMEVVDRVSVKAGDGTGLGNGEGDGQSDLYGEGWGAGCDHGKPTRCRCGGGAG